MPTSQGHAGAQTSTPNPRRADSSVISNFGAMIAAKAPYVWAAAKKKGADCSGAINVVFAESGFSIGGFTLAAGEAGDHGPDTYSQVTDGENVPLDTSDGAAEELKALDPGDVVFFDEPGEGPNSHVALYVGNGMIDEEPEPGMDAHQIPIPLALVDDVQRFVDPATGKPLGQGITGRYNGDDPTGDLSAPKDATDDSVISDLTDPAGAVTKDITKVGGYLVAVTAGVALIGLGIYKTVSPSGGARARAQKSPGGGAAPSGLVKDAGDVAEVAA